MRIALPATTDYWVNDVRGDPIFVVTAQANAGMVRMLPELLSEIRKLVGRRRVTVVFDRGGWCFKLFRDILSAGFNLLTYRKAPFPRVRLKAFKKHTATLGGRHVKYYLADQNIRLKGGLCLRQVTRLSPGGHQTPILTSRRDLSAAVVAFRMFERWRQENFFKYLRAEFALDALVDYDVEPDDATREIPNPARKAINDRLRDATEQMNRLSAELGLREAVNMDDLRAFAKRTKSRADGLIEALGEVIKLKRERAKIPARVPVGAVKAEVIKLDTERKHLTNLLKMVAYQAESDLVRLLAPHYQRVEEEGRTLVQNALASAADIQVCNDELRITLAPLSSPHRSRAIAALCRELNLRRVAYPGTRLTLQWFVHGAE
jgi:hypothetical protein